MTVSSATATPGGLAVNTFTIWSTNSGNICVSRLGSLNASGTDTVRVGATLTAPQGGKIDIFRANPAITVS